MPDQKCENCDLYWWKEFHQFPPPHACFKCEGCRQSWQVRINYGNPEKDRERPNAKTEKEAIAEIKEGIQDHLKGEWMPQHHLYKCKEAYEKGDAKINIYRPNGSHTVLPVGSTPPPPNILTLKNWKNGLRS